MAQVDCAAPTGMMPGCEQLGEGFFSLHASDRATALDRTMAKNAHLLRQLAAQHHALFADTYGALTRTSIPRASLMNNQWHPNDEGGRMYAVTLLRTWGVTEEEMARTGDARDLTYYRALEAMQPEGELASAAVKTPSAPLQGTVILLAAFGDNQLLAYAPDGRPLAVLPTANHPDALAYAARRRELFVACEGAGRLQIFSLPALKPVREVDLGLEAYPTSLALSADEGTLWIGGYFGKLIEFDVASEKVRRTIAMPDVVNGVALTPDGSTVLVALQGKLLFVDPATGSILTTLNTVKFTAPFVSLSAGKPELLDAAHWQLLPIDLAAKQLGNPEPAPLPTRALAIDPAGGHLFACDWKTARLLEYDGPRCLRTTLLPVSALALLVVQVTSQQ